MVLWYTMKIYNNCRVNVLLLLVVVVSLLCRTDLNPPHPGVRCAQVRFESLNPLPFQYYIVIKKMYKMLMNSHELTLKHKS